MTRLPDWDSRLLAFMRSCAGMPFDPVTHNCCAFVAGALRAMTDTDPLARLGIEMPSTELEVARTLVAHGGVRGIAERFFGAKAEPAVLCARRGDVLIAPADIIVGNDRETLGIADGAGVTFVTQMGSWSAPLTSATGFWRVG